MDKQKNNAHRLFKSLGNVISTRIAREVELNREVLLNKIDFQRRYIFALDYAAAFDGAALGTFTKVIYS